MGLGLCSTALAQCPFGVAPAPLTFLPSPTVFGTAGPLGHIADCIPFVNITPFGVCSSLLNPATAALTAAALGILTPGPCIPTPAGTWIPAAPNILCDMGPMLNTEAMLICAYGGVIKPIMPAQFTVMY
ncbi:MAG: DUF4280 domain-containing protein [Alphaproteobacteria bacterium]|nr:DUF4280 domain-containing protein [Alphaproteobacteria bacterium]